MGGSKKFEVEENSHNYRVLERTRETTSDETIMDTLLSHYDYIVTDIDKLNQSLK